MLIEAVGVVAVSAIGGAAAGLYIGDTVRFGTEHAQEGLRDHGAGSDLHVVRFLNDAAPLAPVVFQLKDDFLKRLHWEVFVNWRSRAYGRLPIFVPRASRSVAPGTGAGRRRWPGPTGSS